MRFKSSPLLCSLVFLILMILPAQAYAPLVPMSASDATAYLGNTNESQGFNISTDVIVYYVTIKDSTCSYGSGTVRARISNSSGVLGTSDALSYDGSGTLRNFYFPGGVHLAANSTPDAYTVNTTNEGPGAAFCNGARTPVQYDGGSNCYDWDAVAGCRPAWTYMMGIFGLSAPFDTTAPIIRQIYPLAGSVTNDSAVNFTVYASDDGALLNVSIYGNWSSDWCYQESADASSPCGGLATGDYSFGRGWANTTHDYNNTGAWTNPLQVIDGDWNTYGNAKTDDPDGLLLINYTIPNGVATAIWQVKTETGGIINYTLPANCTNNGTVHLKLESIVAAPPNGYAVGWCKSGDEDNNNLDLVFATNSLSLHGFWDYEEGIYWKMHSYVNPPLYNDSNMTFQISALSNGTYLWWAGACDESGNCDITGNRTFSIGAAVPTTTTTVPPTTTTIAPSGYVPTYQTGDFVAIIFDGLGSIGAAIIPLSALIVLGGGYLFLKGTI